MIVGIFFIKLSGPAVDNTTFWKQWHYSDLFRVFFETMSAYVIPFAYGTLGACAYLLRISERRLRMRDFDSCRIPEHRTRLVLGTLSGGMIVLFISADLLNAKNGGGSAFVLVQGALGFIAGYSIDFLFDVIDRIIKAILPSGGLDALVG